MIEAVPDPESDAAKKYGGGHVACWINSADWESARARASALVASAGWLVRRTIEEKEVSAESYRGEESGLEYFEQALTDGEVCVFYTFPKS